MSLAFVPLFLIDHPFTELLIVNTIYVAYGFGWSNIFTRQEGNIYKLINYVLKPKLLCLEEPSN